MQKKEVAATVVAIRAICRRFRITGRMSFMLAKAEYALAGCYPEPDGEFLNQSDLIIGGERGGSNVSGGRRTTRVILASK